MDVEDINAHLQRKDAELLLKRLPKPRTKAMTPVASAQPTALNVNTTDGAGVTA